MIGLIIMFTAIKIIRNREEYGKISLFCSIFYFAGIPVVVWDYFINSNQSGGINWIMTQNLLNMTFRYSFIICGVYLLVTGLELIYNKLTNKEENPE